VLAVTVVGLLGHRSRPLPSAVVTGAGVAARTLYGHIGELLNLPVIVTRYQIAAQGERITAQLVVLAYETRGPVGEGRAER
jgi:hypothetical protein